MIKFEEKGKATAEKSTRAIEQSYAATADTMREYGIKMINMAQANTEAVFALARELASANAPADLATVLTNHARKQFEILSEQTKELTTLWQKMADEEAEPIVRSVKQSFEKAS